MFANATPLVSAGLPPGQERVFNDDILTFSIEEDVPAAAVCGTGGAAAFGDIPLLGKDNIEKAYNYFVARGLTPEQSAGIVGNMVAESGLDPTIKQGKGGPGRGIVQWSVGDRWDTQAPINGQIANVLAFAKSKNKPPLDLGLQLDFVWQELNNIPKWNKALIALKATSTAGEAAFQILNKYEIAQGYNDPNSPTSRVRQGNAQDILVQFGGGSNSGGGITGASSTAPGAACPGTGDGVVGGDIAKTAIGLAWPEPFKGPASGRANALTPTPAYDNALTQFNPTSRNANNGADCGVFVATVMHASKVDAAYPGINTREQYPYLVNHPNKYQNVTGQPPQAGDIFIVSGRHTWIYIGPQANGYFSSSASLNERAPNLGRETIAGFAAFRVIK